MWQFAAGAVVGLGAFYLYHRFGSKAASLGRELLSRAQGDYNIARSHVASFIVR